MQGTRVRDEEKVAREICISRPRAFPARGLKSTDAHVFFSSALFPSPPYSSGALFATVIIFNLSGYQGRGCIQRHTLFLAVQKGWLAPRWRGPTREEQRPRSTVVLVVTRQPQIFFLCSDQRRPHERSHPLRPAEARVAAKKIFFPAILSRDDRVTGLSKWPGPIVLYLVKRDGRRGRRLWNTVLPLLLSLSFSLSSCFFLSLLLSPSLSILLTLAVYRLDMWRMKGAGQPSYTRRRRYFF